MAEPPADLTERIAERIAGSTRATAVFGKPVERKGVTVIPVARARWAFGGGSGVDPESGANGGGGGGAGTVKAVGYIEVRKDRVVYVPIRDWGMIALASAALAAMGLVAGGVLRRRR
jgi:uncharacterized spore protein YtfJ